ncbi:hypothetical protein SERLA73DRAFT_175916 [Serpula lacrymans var. lacrymans S7.3]|uniref:Uncharacterized protein n=1 Tax=Serpula lacrymans var. lacrymans (strain S7.3) TaxID=936435 RepID=F8PJJ6_SERL3|nr:hypothetical protein SERLA73DRAFT_175916 [Serpula lacrymans var. lacrymans S7.3]
MTVNFVLSTGSMIVSKKALMHFPPCVIQGSLVHEDYCNTLRLPPENPKGKAYWFEGTQPYTTWTGMENICIKFVLVPTSEEKYTTSTYTYLY